MKPSVKNASPVEKALEQMRAALLEEARAKLADLSPSELMALAERRASQPVKKEIDWTKEKHTCPRCNHTGPVVPDFGVKKRRGLEHRQSYCRKCRSETSNEYYAATRKYKTRRDVI